MTVPLAPEAKAIIRESFSTTQPNGGGYRSRGWTPMKYPKSALTQDEESLLYFPLHRDVLLATVRELLILDGTLDAGTLKISDKKVRFIRANNILTSILCYKRHLDGYSWLRTVKIIEDETQYETSGGCNTRCRKRKKRKKQSSNGIKKVKTQTGKGQKTKVLPNTSPVVADIVVEDKLPSAEDLASVILRRVQFKEENNNIPPKNGQKHRMNRPRKISEADETSEISLHIEGSISSSFEEYRHHHTDEEDCEISDILDLGKRNQRGAYVLRRSPTKSSNVVHVSISNEATLRDAAVIMTERLIETFSDTAVKTFFGYKGHPSREQLTQLYAGLLFDISHAMFAWESTEQELLATSPNTANDDMIQKSLFDQRALKRIGGFDSCSVLPHAISIARLRRRKSSWENFATTVQGQKMMAHHAQYKTALSVGKLRRGHRLRQRYWLTSACISNDNDGDLSSQCGIDGTRSRSCSIASSEGGEEEHNQHNNMIPASSASSSAPGHGHGPEHDDRRSRLLQDIPSAKAIDLSKLPGSSWGVCLVKEGEDCVVGRASEVSDGRDSSQHLRCGDMILYAQNDSGDEASSRLSAWLTPELAGQDYYRAVVDLFKKSEKLQLVVQRV